MGHIYSNMGTRTVPIWDPYSAHMGPVYCPVVVLDFHGIVGREDVGLRLKFNFNFEN